MTRLPSSEPSAPRSRPCGFRALLRACLASPVVLATLLHAGCAHYPVNKQLEHVDPQAGYRPRNLARPGNSAGLQVFLAFSGGGTRAAALAYGVLEELERAEVTWEGGRRRLLDEVDYISAVSGGSFTAAYYGLRGDAMFDEFRQRFLDRDVLRDLEWRLLSPRNWVRLASPSFNRSDMVDPDKVRKVVLVIVDASARKDRGIDRSPRPPGLVRTTMALGEVPIERYTYETIQLLRETVRRFETEWNAAAARGAAFGPEGSDEPPRVRFYLIEVSLDDLPREERERLGTLPTSFRLPPGAVDALRQAATRLMRQSADYRDLLRELDGPAHD